MALQALGSGWLPRVTRVLDAFPALAIQSEVPAALASFLDLLVTWNERMDLTAARHADELVDLMLADAAMLASQGTAPGEQWLDIGAGAGAPGLVLALLAPELTLTLVEPRQKRVAFLRTALSTLGRSDVRVERRRSQDLASKSAHIAVARATLPPSEWLPEGARLATQGVWVLLAREQPPVLAGYAPDREVEYVWPLAGAARRAVRYVQQS